MCMCFIVFIVFIFILFSITMYCCHFCFFNFCFMINENDYLIYLLQRVALSVLKHCAQKGPSLVQSGFTLHPYTRMASLIKTRLSDLLAIRSRHFRRRHLCVQLYPRMKGFPLVSRQASNH